MVRLGYKLEDQEFHRLLAVFASIGTSYILQTVITTGSVDCLTLKILLLISSITIVTIGHPGIIIGPDRLSIKYQPMFLHIFL